MLQGATALFDPGHGHGLFVGKAKGRLDAGGTVRAPGSDALPSFDGVTT
jgi:hypothetical protein